MLGWLKRRGKDVPAPAATAASPRGAAELRAEGNTWLDKGDLAKAEACYRQAVAADAADALALINLAYVLNEQQHPAEARVHALQATALDANSVDAFYVLANAKRFSGDSYRLAFDILKEAKVGVTPGIDFGSNAEGYLRFSYANSLENIEEGMNRLQRYLKKYR